MSNERERVAEELRRVGEEVRDGARRADVPSAAAPPAPIVTQAQPLPKLDAPPPIAWPKPPDLSAVNAAWTAEVPARRGIAGLLDRLLSRLLGSRLEAQRAFNARQVQLDNELLAYLTERFAATHEHYDRVLGLYGRHLEEIDERHMILQEELVSHVHALVKRIDFVLAEADRGQLSRAAALEDLRRRIGRIEEALQRRA